MSTPGSVKQVWRYSISDGVPRRSLIVALVVGTIVNLINQGDAMVVGHPLDITKLLATYIVSYLVGTYGAVSYRLHTDRRARGKPAGGPNDGTDHQNTLHR
jgi:hypothetical protein